MKFYFFMQSRSLLKWRMESGTGLKSEDGFLENFQKKKGEKKRGKVHPLPSKLIFSDLSWNDPLSTMMHDA